MRRISLTILLVLCIAHYSQEFIVRPRGIFIPNITPEDTAEFHNTIRQEHFDTADLNGNKDLQNKAKQCALEILSKKKEACQLPSEYGKNVASAQDSFNATYLKFAILHWYKELKKVNFTKEDWPITLTKDFAKYDNGTQVIWKGTTQVGCGGATTAGVPPATVFVCLYNPAGNKEETVSTSDLMKNLGARKNPNLHILHDDGSCKDVSSLCQIIARNQANIQKACDMEISKYMPSLMSKVRTYCRKTCKVC